MKELRAGCPTTVGDLKIVPIEAVGCDRYPVKRGFWVSAFKVPVYVVIVTPTGTKAFDLDGAEVDPNDLPADL